MEKLFDSVAPIPTDDAIAIIEDTQGRPLRELFSRFDPVPIAGGRLRAYTRQFSTTGEQVAVKVRRPGIERSFRADFQVLLFLHGLGEFLGLLRGRETGPILIECQRMLADGNGPAARGASDRGFSQGNQGNSQKEQRRLGVRHSTAGFPAFTCTQVLVTEFVQGISMREILNALQKNNREHLTRLGQLGYDFEYLSKKLLHLMYWQTFEAMGVSRRSASGQHHRDPRPAAGVGRLRLLRHHSAEISP